MAKRTALILGCALLVAGAASAQKTKAPPPAPKAWAAEPTKFFGIRLGAEIKQTDIGNCGMSSTQADPDITVCATGGNDKIITISRFPIAEFESGYVGLVDGTVSVVKARLAQRNFQKARALLVERYGQPTMVNAGTVQNAMGASFSNEELTWVGVNVTLFVRERDGKIDQSGVSVLHHQTVEKGTAKEGEKRQSEAAKF